MDIFGLAILAELLSGVGSGLVGGAGSMASAMMQVMAERDYRDAMLRIERQKKVAAMLNRWQGRS